jgi:hypothetical protein
LKPVEGLMPLVEVPLVEVELPQLLMNLLPLMPMKMLMH